MSSRRSSDDSSYSCSTGSPHTDITITTTTRESKSRQRSKSPGPKPIKIAKHEDNQDAKCEANHVALFEKVLPPSLLPLTRWFLCSGNIGGWL